MRLFFKCENFQKGMKAEGRKVCGGFNVSQRFVLVCESVGAFKFRGACNAVFALSKDAAAKGVCTHSSGNFAQALALAARMRGAPAHIVMPSNAPAVKKNAVKGYGATVIECEPTLAAREKTAQEVVTHTPFPAPSPSLTVQHQTHNTRQHKYQAFNRINSACGM
jgi:cysteine synthase